MTSRILLFRPILVTIVVVLIATSWFAWSRHAGAGKLTAAEITLAGASSGDADRLDIEIMLGFEPEQFHFLRLQEIGRMAGASNRSVRLRDVPLQSARHLARQYWVSDIVPLEPQ